MQASDRGGGGGGEEEEEDSAALLFAMLASAVLQEGRKGSLEEDGRPRQHVLLLLYRLFLSRCS